MLIGFTAGAIIGLLYAPQKGSKTRRKLANLGNDMKEGWNRITDRVADKIDGVRSSVDNLADSAVDKVQSTQFETDAPTMTGNY